MRSVLTVGFAWALALSIPALAATAQPSEPLRRSISVSGAADVRVQPDHVILELGVEVRGDDLNAAKNQNDADVERILTFLREQLRAEDVRTDYIAITPTYHWQTGARTFTVQRSIIATIRDVSTFESILTGCVSRGVTNVHGVRFRTSALKAHREAARALAVKAALEKAGKLAADARVQTGRVLTINENTWGGWSSWSAGYWGRASGGQGSQVSVSSPGPSDDAMSTLALGEITVSATVQLSVELK